MLNEALSRRHIALYLTGGAAALTVAGCTQTQVDAVQKAVSNLIEQVQQGVVTACSAVGKLIPTASSVFAVLASIVGSGNVVIATAVMVEAAVSAIVGVACGTPAPTGAQPVHTTDKGVPIKFY